MSIKINSIRDNLAWLLLSFFLIVAVAVQVLEFTDDMMNMFKALAGLICYLFGFIYCNRKLVGKSVVYGVAMSSFMVLNIIMVENATWVHLLWIWAYLGVAMLLFDFGIPRRFVIIIFYSVCAYFLYLAFSGSFIKEILTHGSANHVSILCVFYMFLYYLSFRSRKVELLPYIPVLVVLFLSFWTASRAGILSCALFFLLLLRHNFKHSNTKTQKIVFFAVIGLLAAGVAYFFINYFDMFDEALLDKVDKQGMESARSEIWKEYFRGMTDNIEYFFFGVFGDSPMYPALRRYDGNPHNSFLMLHAKFGLLGFVFIIFFLFKSLKKMFKKKDSLLISLFLLSFLRCFFDWNAFPGLYDVIFWFFVFYKDLDPRYNKYQHSLIV